VNVLIVGDIVGSAGRRVVKEMLPGLISRYMVDLCIANVENAAGGVGVTPEIAGELLLSGIQVLTSGNHIWDKKEIAEYISAESRLLRPANYPPGTPGSGSCLIELPGRRKVGILNLAGRVFMRELDCPFRVADQEVERLKHQTNIIIVDFHAEATSEKIALGWHLDGRVSAVVGTHTHVQTADESILPQGTAYITDIGMTGPFNSVIGIKKESVLQRFITQLPVRFEAAKGDPRFNGVFIQIDPASGKAQHIERLNIGLER